MKYKIKELCRTIKTFFFFGWRLRKNRGWDYSYIYTALKAQIDLHVKEYSKEEIYVGQHRDLIKLKIIQECLKRAIDEDYIEEDPPFNMPKTIRYKREKIRKLENKEMLFHYLSKYLYNFWI